MPRVDHRGNLTLIKTAASRTVDDAARRRLGERNLFARGSRLPSNRTSPASGGDAVTINFSGTARTPLIH